MQNPKSLSLLTSEQNSQRIITETDDPWKQALNLFFKPFIELCLPHFTSRIDWSKGYESLSTELHEIFPDSKKGKRISDMLFKVFLNNGKEQKILIHLEIQGQKQAGFPHRMYVYNYRSYDKHKRQDPVISVALLLDEKNSWRPDCFEMIDPFLEKPYLQFSYHVVKFLDYAEKKQELQQQKNIFSIIILAQLAVMEGKKNPDQKLKNKLALTRELYQRGLKKEEISQLFVLVDWLIKLPEDLMITYKKQVKETAEEEGWDQWDPVYVSTFEQVAKIEAREEGIKARQEGLQEGLQEGRQEGRQEGQSSLLSKLLNYRFPRAVTAKYLELINNADGETLSTWGERLMEATSIEEVFSGRPLRG
ncbi:MAG: Rpn family recombination-promoting nuclease/putative transposase [Chthoniobacterales bacterium]